MLVLEVDILRLDITVNDVVLVEIVDGTQQLPDDASGFDLAEASISGHTLIKSSSVHHLVNEVNLLLVFVHLDNGTDVRVIELL